MFKAYFRFTKIRKKKKQFQRGIEYEVHVIKDDANFKMQFIRDSLVYNLFVNTFARFFHTWKEDAKRIRSHLDCIKNSIDCVDVMWKMSEQFTKHRFYLNVNPSAEFGIFEKKSNIPKVSNENSVLCK